jgi:uncharacterized membrane protein
MSLHFEPVWSWTLTLLAAAAVLFVMRLGYPRRIAHLPSGWKRLLLLLRFLTAALLILLLLRPVAVIRSADESDAILYILADASRSVQTEDEPGGGTRRQALLKLLKDVEPALQQLREKVEIRIRDFAEGIQAVESPGEAAEGPMTAFGAVLEKTGEEIGRSRVPAVLMLSDGRQAASGSLDSDPLAPARQFGRQQRPIYTVGFGSAQATGSSLDLALDDLDLSREIFQGNVLPVRVRLNAVGAQGQPVRVRVLLENRNGLLDGQSGEMQPVPAGEDSRPVVSVTPAGSAEEQTIQLQIVPAQTGDLKLAVEADPLPGEVRKTNNRVETIIRVRRGGIRVAYFDIVRSEQKWIRQINDSSRIQLDFHPIRSGRFRALTKVPDRFFEPGVYDAFVIGDVPASVFSARQLQAMLDCCNLGAGLMMTGGRENFGAGGYGQSPLAALFPVELPAENPQLATPLRMVPTRDGLGHYVLQIAAPDQNRPRWDQLPPLSGANLLTLKAGRLAEVLAASEDGAPLLIGESVGPARVLMFAGDTTWQWTMKGFAEEHTRFWRQVILWLTRKETDDEQPLWINANPRDLTPGQPTELTFGVRDAQGVPVAGVTYDVKVTDPDGTTHPVAAVGGADGDFATFDKTLLPGDYWARMQATKDGQLIPGIAVTRFHVNQRDPELDNPAADYALLREISHASGGELLTPEQLMERLDRWATDGLPGMALERQERRSLWDNWLVLLLIASLMVTEWAVRKRRGLV